MAFINPDNRVCCFQLKGPSEPHEITVKSVPASGRFAWVVLRDPSSAFNCRWKRVNRETEDGFQIIGLDKRISCIAKMLGEQACNKRIHFHHG
jgi:hypothetical protein